MAASSSRSEPIPNPNQNPDRIPSTTVLGIQNLLDLDVVVAISKNDKAVVRVVTQWVMIDENDLAGGPIVYAGIQTGFVIKEGLIVTAAHGLCERESQSEYQPFCVKLIEVSDLNGSGSEMELVTPLAIDTGTDIALLLLPTLARANSTTFLELEEKEAIPGQFTYTTGHPASYGFARTFACISCPRRTLNYYVVPHLEKKPEDFYVIEVDKKYAQGYSGGPHIAASGKVISVNHSFSCVEGHNVSYTVPVQFVKELVVWHMQNPKLVFRRGDGQARFANILNDYIRTEKLTSLYSYLPPPESQNPQYSDTLELSDEAVGLSTEVIQALDEGAMPQHQLLVGGGGGGGS